MYLFLSFNVRISYMYLAITLWGLGCNAHLFFSQEVICFFFVFLFLFQETSSPSWSALLLCMFFLFSFLKKIYPFKPSTHCTNKWARCYRPTFYQIYKKKSTEGFQSVPYVISLFSAMLWIYYALLKENALFLITINSVCAVIQFGYISAYLFYAPKKARVHIS